MRVLVTGSRNWRNRELLERVLDGYYAALRFDILVEGCARGADRMAEDWARKRKVNVAHFPAQWEAYGKSAGPRRNMEMLKTLSKTDLVLAFHEDFESSKGTRNMVNIARAKGVDVITFDDPDT